MSNRVSKWNRLSGKYAFNARDWRYEMDGVEDEVDLSLKRLLPRSPVASKRRRHPAVMRGSSLSPHIARRQEDLSPER